VIHVKKTLAVTLSLALTISMLSACGGSGASEDAAETAVVEAASAETTAPEAETEETAQVPTDSREEVSEKDLLEYFQYVYDSHTYEARYGDAVRLKRELKDLRALAISSVAYRFPSDYEDRYIEWRSTNQPSSDAQTSSDSDTSTSESDTPAPESTTAPSTSGNSSSTSGGSKNTSTASSDSSGEVGESDENGLPIVKGVEPDNGEIGEYLDPSTAEAGHYSGVGLFGSD
jgi:hypothetical protein